MKQSIILLLFIILFPLFIQAQGVSINEDNSIPDASAILEVKSATKGILIPRVALQSPTDQKTIEAPAVSLLVYNITNSNNLTPGFYYFDGTKWIALATASNNNTARNLSNNAWDLTGNAGLNSTHFIGTTDAQVLNFGTDNIIRARLTPQGQLEFLNTGNSIFIGEGAGVNDDLSNNENVFIGVNAGSFNTSGSNNTIIGSEAFLSNTIGYDNTVLGYRGLYSNTSGMNNYAGGSYALYSNTTGSNNVAIGFSTLMNNTVGNLNTAIGNESLKQNTTGSANTAIGEQALRFNTTGFYNTAIGEQALYSNTIGFENTGNGRSALYSNTTGEYNSAHGAVSLYANTIGRGNTANGYSALSNNTTGAYNTALGIHSLDNNKTGIDNTAIGSYTYLGNNNYNNSTAIGYNTNITASNQIRLGNNAVTSIGGYTSWSNISDARFKTNIKENVAGLDFINQLRPVTYHLDMDAIAAFNKIPDSLRLLEAEAQKAQLLQTGFIAQEVEETALQLGYDFSGVDAPKNENDHYGLRYAEFTVPLVKAVQELSQKLEVVQEQNAQLKKEIAVLEALKTDLSTIKALLKTTSKSN